MHGSENVKNKLHSSYMFRPTMAVFMDVVIKAKISYYLLY